MPTCTTTIDLERHLSIDDSGNAAQPHWLGWRSVNQLRFYAPRIGACAVETPAAFRLTQHRQGASIPMGPPGNCTKIAKKC